MEAYLDNSATTKCAREVVETVVKAMQDDYGNPYYRGSCKECEAKYDKEYKKKKKKSFPR